MSELLDTPQTSLRLSSSPPTTTGNSGAIIVTLSSSPSNIPISPKQLSDISSAQAKLSGYGSVLSSSPSSSGSPIPMIESAIVTAAISAAASNNVPSPSIKNLESLLHLKQLEIDMLKDRLTFADKQIKERDTQIDHYKSLVQTLQTLVTANLGGNVGMGLGSLGMLGSENGMGNSGNSGNMNNGSMNMGNINNNGYHNSYQHYNNYNGNGNNNYNHPNSYNNAQQPQQQQQQSSNHSPQNNTINGNSSSQHSMNGFHHNNNNAMNSSNGYSSNNNGNGYSSAYNNHSSYNHSGNNSISNQFAQNHSGGPSHGSPVKPPSPPPASSQNGRLSPPLASQNSNNSNQGGFPKNQRLGRGYSQKMSSSAKDLSALIHTQAQSPSPQPLSKSSNSANTQKFTRIGKERKCVSFHEDVTVHYFEGKDQNKNNAIGNGNGILGTIASNQNGQYSFMITNKQNGPANSGLHLALPNNNSNNSANNSINNNMSNSMNNGNNHFVQANNSL